MLYVSPLEMRGCEHRELASNGVVVLWIIMLHVQQRHISRSCAENVVFLFLFLSPGGSSLD